MPAKNFDIGLVAMNVRSFKNREVIRKNLIHQHCEKF
jgi:hypothetical protein